MRFEDALFFAKLHDSGVVLSEADVAMFEQEIGNSLPSDYRRFLLLRNGGYFNENIVVFPEPDQSFAEQDQLMDLFSPRAIAFSSRDRHYLNIAIAPCLNFRYARPFVREASLVP